MNTKALLKQQYLSLRQNLPQKERLRNDDLMLLQFQQLDFTEVQTVLTYWPIEKFAEPNTHLFSSYLRHFVPNLTICYPVSDFATTSLQAIEITEDTVYIANANGLTQPKQGNIISPQQIDLVFVPLIVCDKNGYRVGYGKGFYDKFLSECKGTCAKMGFSYFEPIDKIEDVANWDIPLNLCITPNTIHEF